MGEDRVREVAVESFTRRCVLYARVCPHCGSEFMGHALRVYCSTRCARQAAWHRNGPRYVAKCRAAKAAMEARGSDR